MVDLLSDKGCTCAGDNTCEYCGTHCVECGAKLPCDDHPAEDYGDYVDAVAQVRRKTAEAEAAAEAARPPFYVTLNALRGIGWTVAAHNDFRHAGELHTFWMFTKGTTFVQGRGRTDGEALECIRLELLQREAVAEQAAQEFMRQMRTTS